jgi:pheromone shutdown protein TraB
LFAGLLQVTIYKPRVSDIHNIGDDVTSLKGVYRNRISRALMVFFFTGIFGAIGSFVALPIIARLLAL